MTAGIQHLLAGGEAEVTDLSGRNRSIRGVFRPRTRHDVAAVLKWAGSNPAVRLHPTSCGHNWGFGSALPVEDGAFILDLSRLAAIRKLDLTSGYVELEPGVTQGMLDAALQDHGRSHYFNVTGAGKSTSLIGNALERGIGYFGSRQNDILELEVMLPNGELLQTSSDLTTPFHTGLGPDLQQLFFQSAFGIVTAAKIRLFKRPEVMGALMLKLQPGIHVGELVQVLGEMRSEGMFHSVPHIANQQRAYTTFGPYFPPEQRAVLQKSMAPWSAIVPISGSANGVKALHQDVALRLSKWAGCELLVPSDQVTDACTQSLLDLVQGIPTDVALPGVAFAALGRTETPSLRVEDGESGLIHVVPGCAPRIDEVRRLLELIDSVRARHNFEPLAQTINLVNGSFAVVVISVPFQRAISSSSSRAVEFANELNDRCFAQGFTPYRLGLDDATRLPANGSGRSKVLRQIQKALDPAGILCSSKYDPLFAAGEIRTPVKLCDLATTTKENLNLQPTI